MNESDEPTAFAYAVLFFVRFEAEKRVFRWKTASVSRPIIKARYRRTFINNTRNRQRRTPTMVESRSRNAGGSHTFSNIVGVQRASVPDSENWCIEHLGGTDRYWPNPKSVGRILSVGELYFRRFRFGRREYRRRVTVKTVVRFVFRLNEHPRTGRWYSI